MFCFWKELLVTCTEEKKTNFLKYSVYNDVKTKQAETKTKQTILTWSRSRRLSHTNFFLLNLVQVQTFLSSVLRSKLIEWFFLVTTILVTILFLFFGLNFTDQYIPGTLLCESIWWIIVIRTYKNDQVSELFFFLNYFLSLNFQNMTSWVLKLEISFWNGTFWSKNNENISQNFEN